tara:strand:- start:22 stop:345 length:324 start_codon:yes stop_codon:yes gene_type:complete
MIVAAILNSILSSNNDLEPFGGSNTPQESRDMRRRGAAAMAAMDRRTRKDSNDSTRSPVVPRGPTAAEQLAAKKAAKLAARKKKGKAQRKKYEEAMTMKNKMKLLFT